VISVIHQAVQNDAVNSLRELVRLFPGNGSVVRLALACELELALHFKRAVALLVPDEVPVRVLFPASEPGEAANLSADGGHLQIAQRNVRLIDRLRGATRQGTWDIVVLDASQNARTILTAKGVGDSVMTHLKDTLPADVADLPLQGHGLQDRVLECCVPPPPELVPYLEACRAMSDDWAVLFELIGVRALEGSSDVEKAIRQGSFELQADPDREGLEIRVSLDDFFKQFDAT
jgi:hypothetical protein